MKKKTTRKAKKEEEYTLKDLKLLAYLSNQVWPIEAQLSHASEEIGEYLTALSHYRRKRIPLPKLIEEIADVVIMMFAIADYYGVEEFDKQIVKKIKLTASRVKECLDTRANILKSEKKIARKKKN